MTKPLATLRVLDLKYCANRKHQHPFSTKIFPCVYDFTNVKVLVYSSVLIFFFFFKCECLRILPAKKEKTFGLLLLEGSLTSICEDIELHLWTRH